MKIPFDIKYRPQIESGEYKVVTRDNTPVRIVCWDANNPQPIVGLVYDNVAMYDIVVLFCGNGKYCRLEDKDSAFDLFIVTPEPELTEFEQEVCTVSNLCLNLEMKDEIHSAAKQLLAIAKKELFNGWSKCFNEYWLGRKKAIEEVGRVFHYEGPTIPTFWPICPNEGGQCTNPMRDCINCPLHSTNVCTNTGTSTSKVEG